MKRRGRRGERASSRCKGPVPGKIPLAILTPDNHGTGDPKTGRLTGNFVHQDEGSKSPLCKCPGGGFLPYVVSLDLSFNSKEKGPADLRLFRL